MTVRAKMWGTLCRPFEWALSLIREPALLALWVLVPIAAAHACARWQIDLQTVASAVHKIVDYFSHITHI
jgi:hypothetical protein